MYETAVILVLALSAALFATGLLVALDEFVDYDDE